MWGNFGRLTQKGYIQSRFDGHILNFGDFVMEQEKDIQMVENAKYDSRMLRVIIITSP